MYDELHELMAILRLSEEDAMKAILGQFVPTDPGVLRGVLLKRPDYGGDVPTTDEIWSLFVKADFRCSQCGGRRRLSLDHINRDSTNSSLANLRVRCFDCNRAESSRPTKNKDHRLRIYRSCIKLFRQLGRFPRQCEAVKDAGITTNISGAVYMHRLLKVRLEKPGD